MINASKTIEQGDGIMGQRVSKGRGHSSRGGGGGRSLEASRKRKRGRRKLDDASPPGGSMETAVLGKGLRAQRP